jgi:hypothetical protein
MNKKDTEKVELRLKVNKWVKEDLDEYCDTLGVSAVSTIVPLLVEYLGRASRGREVVVNHRLTPNNSRASTNRGNDCANSKKKKQKHPLPEDFDPPREISEAAGLDHEKAVIAFTDWAVSKGHTYADWIATYRNACRSWLADKFPNARRTSSIIEKVI